MSYNLWGGKTIRIMLITTLVVIVSMLMLPIAFGVYISFLNKHSFLSTSTFTGISNYISVFRDKEFWNSFLNGIIYATVSVLLQMIIGVYCALYLNKPSTLHRLSNAIIIFPYLLPTVVAAILWKWLLNESNSFLSNGNSWFDSQHIMITLIFVSVWQFFPFVTIFTLARLKTIPERLYRAAEVDGANSFQKFWHVTLPELKDTLLVLLFIRFIWMFTKFDTVWLIAGKGGSLESAQNLPVLAYRYTFKFFQAGMGATVSTIMLVFIVLGSHLYFKKFLNK